MTPDLNAIVQVRYVAIVNGGAEARTATGRLGDLLGIILDDSWYGWCATIVC